MTTSPPKSLADHEPTMGRMGHRIDPAKLQADRNILHERAQAWGDTPTQKHTLANGWAKAQNALLILSVSQDGTGASTPLMCRAYGIDSLLALGGKGRAKKGLLELASRENGVFAPWFSTGCEKILRDSAQTMSFNSWGSSPDGDAMRAAESAMLDLSRPSPTDHGGRRLLTASASLKNATYMAALDKALDVVFGSEFIDLMPTLRPGDSLGHRPPGPSIEQAIAWANSRTVAILIGASSPKPAEDPSLSKPRL